MPARICARARMRSFFSLGFIGVTYKFRNTNKRMTATAKSVRTPRTRAVFLPKAHSALAANLLALVLVFSRSALMSCQSFPCTLSYGNLAASLCLKLYCS